MIIQSSGTDDFTQMGSGTRRPVDYHFGLGAQVLLSNVLLVNSLNLPSL